jgi:hypothetical protein
MSSLFSPFQQSALKAMGYTLYVERSAQTPVAVAQSAPVSNAVELVPVTNPVNMPRWISKLARHFSEQHIQYVQWQSLSPNASKAKREVWQQLRKVLRTQ